MITEYILDLDKEEYRDDFVNNENNEFWQFEARDSLIEKLTTTLNDAKSYKIARQEKPNKIWLSHNAILVSGQRGAGKTVFLRNCAEIWKNEQSNGGNHKAGELHFLQEIDPTMLINEDNFSNVVIAQIYSEVELKLQSENCCDNSNVTLDKYKSTFHKALKRLADSLGKQDDFNGFTGIDKIQQYKSGIHIQRYFNEFIEAAINILGCSALVLPIDDVDMALDRAFEVVDDVRRLLGCPYIIPIVSGDYRLYSQMANVHFDEKSYRDKSSNEKLQEEGQELAKQLSNAYLTKVFPNQMRITLLPIMFIIPTLTIKQQNYDGKATNYKYKDYKNALLQQFYTLCHNKEVLDNWPEPESARELTQLIRAMSPKSFENSLSENSSQLNYKLWKIYINWAEQKQNGVAFTNANSYLSLVNRDPVELFDIQELPNFNPKHQMIKELYPWAKKDFYNSQLSALGFSNTQNDEKLPQVIKDNRTLLDSAFNENSYTLRSMPPLEFIDTKSFVSIGAIAKAISEAKQVSTSMFLSNKNNEPKDSKTGKSSSEDDISFKVERILFDLYTHGDIYSTLQNTYQYVFMSRAFEVVFYSFINNSPQKQETDLVHILTKTPFYSVFNMASTKAILSEEEEETNLPVTSRAIRRVLRRSEHTTSLVLNKLIKDWKSKHDEFFSNLDSRLLVPIFTYIFNKTFTSFNEFKKEVFSKRPFGSKPKPNEPVTSEHLTDFAKRFEYMLINSAHTAVIQGVAVQANVAFTDNHNTIRSVSAFNRSDRVLTRNRKRFKQEIDQADKSSANNFYDMAGLFIKALESHPIFKLIQEESKSGKGFVTTTIPPKIKMGQDKDEVDKPVKDDDKVVAISAELIDEVKRYIKSRNDIPNTMTNMDRFIGLLKNNESAREFYQKNVSSSVEDFKKLEVMNKGKGMGVNNFIVALIKVYKAL
jgi:hypothetical protein